MLDWVTIENKINLNLYTQVKPRILSTGLAKTGIKELIYKVVTNILKKEALVKLHTNYGLNCD